MTNIYTIGHSSHSREYFLDLLKKYDINSVIDIRNIPFSRYVSHFNKDTIKRYLNENSIYCIYMADEFGAVRDDPSLFHSDGYLDYTKIASRKQFWEGIERVKTGIAKGYRIALMCTEKDPIDCHRSIMLAPVLSDEGYSVLHILENGSLETQAQFNERLLNMYFPKTGQENFFNIIGNGSDSTELIKKAYKLRNRDIGYRLKKK